MCSYCGNYESRAELEQEMLIENLQSRRLIYLLKENSWRYHLKEYASQEKAARAKRDKEEAKFCKERAIAKKNGIERIYTLCLKLYEGK